MIGSHDLLDMAIDLLVTNISDEIIQLSCRRYELDTITASSLYMCWANCTVLPFGGTVELNPDETTDVFSAHINPNMHFGVERNLYTFYNEINPSDSMSFVATFVTTDFLLSKDDHYLIHSVVDLFGATGEEIIFNLDFLENLSSTNTSIQVQQVPVNLAEGSEIFCTWNDMDYTGPTVTESVILIPGINSGLFQAKLQASSSMGTSIVEYYFTDVNNPENVHKLSLIFHIDAVGISEYRDDVFLIYPNPSSGNLQIINYGTLQEDCKVYIYEMGGHLVYKSDLRKMQDQQDLFLISGQYIVQIISESQSLKTEKLVVY